MIRLKEGKEGIEGFEMRLLYEQEDLATKVGKLSKFIESEKFNELGDEMKELLKKQLVIMKGYNQILIKRLNLLGFEITWLV